MQVEIAIIPVRATPADVLWKILSAEERARAERYRFEDDQRRSIVARGALRIMLARRLQCDPKDLQFVEGPQGKPALVDDALEFNVSHSGDRVAIAITEGTPVGIDIEVEQPRMTDLNQLARRYFSRIEADEVESQQGDAAMRLFFTIWTAKEAVIKAAGGGLSIDLAAFSVLPVTEEWREVTNLSGAAELDGWQVVAVPSAEGYRAALCVRRCDYAIERSTIFRS